MSTVSQSLLDMERSKGEGVHAKADKETETKADTLVPLLLFGQLKTKATVKEKVERALVKESELVKSKERTQVSLESRT